MQDSLAAFTGAMLLALPVALILYSALAAWVHAIAQVRSGRGCADPIGGRLGLWLHRFPALRRAGEGTGVLTAVTIAFSLLVSLMVMPSVLLVVTRRRTGAERQHLLDLTGIAPGEYDPHSRQTALEGQEAVSH